MVVRTKNFDDERLCDLCVNGDLKTIQSEFADVDFNEFLLLNGQLMTPLMVASEYGHKELIKWLLKNEANIRICSAGKTALHYAVDNQHTDIAKLIYRQDKEFFEKQMFFGAIVQKNTKFVLFLLNEGYTFSNKDFISALEKGTVEMVDAFIDNGAYFQCRKDVSFPLKTKWKRFVRCIISPCVNKYEPLEKAVMSGNYNTTKKLIERGADVVGNLGSYNFDLPILQAIKSDNTKIVDLFLQNGVSMTDCSSHDTTPVDYAVIYGTPQMAAYFLKQADVSKKFYYGFGLSVDPVDGPYAYLHSHDVFKHTKVGYMTGLFASVALKRLDIAKELVQLGYDVNGSDSTGFTPLMAAAEKGNFDFVKFFISKGADIEAKNQNGLDALQIARQSNQNPIATYLSHVLNGLEETEPNVIKRELTTAEQKESEEVKKELNSFSKEQLMELPNKNLRLYRMVQKYGLEEFWFNKMPYLSQIEVYKMIRKKMNRTARLKVEEVMRQARGRGGWC